MMNEPAARVALQRLIVDDAVGQLRRRDGRMAILGSEDGALKLDWVEAVARLFADPSKLEEVEAEARAIRDRGIRHIIWAGMGGSVLAVRVLCELGFCDGHDEPPTSDAPEPGGGPVAIYPLDSTDPAALNAIVRTIAAAKHLALPPEHGVHARPASGSGPEHYDASEAGLLHALLHDVMMIGVSMGMTSEEPITHLEWFSDLLEWARLPPAQHLLVMTLPGSYLDAFAREHQAPSRPLQLDGRTGTGGRMSAPATRVFLLPAAIYLTRLPGAPGLLRSVLQRAWNTYDLELAAARPAEHPFVQLAAALSGASSDGACRLLLAMPDGWRVLVSWLEQLMEESLGKGGKGIVVFDDQKLNLAAPGYHQGGTLDVQVVAAPPPTSEPTKAAHDRHFVLAQPALASTDPRDRLSALAASFLGWQLTMALYGYLHQIPFAGQPAVENYKARARALRAERDPLQLVSNWQQALQDGSLTLLAPRVAAGAGSGAGERHDPRRGNLGATEHEAVPPLPAAAFARALRDANSWDDGSEHVRRRTLGYVDVTINGEAPADVVSLLNEQSRIIGNTLLGVPVKLRHAPAAYHSTEQSEMDGPAYLVSLRLVARRTEACLLGDYSNSFLHAQAISTWQAMMETGRPCYLLVIEGSLRDARGPLATFLADVERRLHDADHTSPDAG